MTACCNFLTAPCHAGHAQPSLRADRKHQPFACMGSVCCQLSSAKPLSFRELEPGAKLPLGTCITTQASASGSYGSGSSGGNSSKGGGNPLTWLQRWQQDTRQMQEQLKALGVAGVIAYGLFNTLYYSGAFLFVWFTIANAQSGLGWAPAAQKAAEVFALVWAGSQVTKLLRAAAAIACAPLIDKAIHRMGFQDKQKAYMFIVLGCVLLASAVIGLVVVLHA